MKNHLNTQGAWVRAALPALALACILAGAAALRGYHIGAECFDCDELYAVRIHGLSVRNVALVMARDSFHTNHPFLMTVPFLFWEQMFGVSQSSVRLLPLLLGVGAVGLTYSIGRRLGGLRAGLAAAIVLAFNPLHVAYSQEARQYAMLVTLVLAAHWAYIRALSGGGRGVLFVYFTAVFAAIFTHYFAIPALAPHGVVALWLLLRGNADCRRSAAALFLTLVAAVIPFLAWLPVVAFQSGVIWPHLRDASAGSLIDCLVEVAGVGAGGLPLTTAATLLLILVGGIGCWSARTRLPTSPGTNARGPLAPWVGAALSVGGVLAACVSAFAAPRYALEPAKDALRSYGYDPTAIAAEIQLLHVELVAFPAALAVTGAILFSWDWWFQLLCRPRASGGSGRPITAGAFVLALVVGPLVVIELMALRGVPFLSSRNLLILAPTIALAVGLGISTLLRRLATTILAVGVVLFLAVCAFRYEPIAAPFGFAGIRLGMHTGPWDRLAAAMDADTRPVASGDWPATDPMLYYVNDRMAVRVHSSAELISKIPAGGFFYVELTGDARSAELSREIENAGVRLTPLWRQENLVLFDADREGQP